MVDTILGSFRNDFAVDEYRCKDVRISRSQFLGDLHGDLDAVLPGIPRRKAAHHLNDVYVFVFSGLHHLGQVRNRTAPGYGEHRAVVQHAVQVFRRGFRTRLERFLIACLAFDRDAVLQAVCLAHCLRQIVILGNRTVDDDLHNLAPARFV
jgi:hypothetical protein